ncbi:glycosyltransferase family 2 protein [Jeotgalibaca porci]|uniref:glycosyltransferase family 2 protein n=1 Tax=Jeotgalibaca porci TaxID=1868793 RepID=UPI003F926FC5
MISIVVPSYNREKTIKRCIDSLLLQTYKDLEIIIVDDASTDNTEDIIKLYNDERLHYVKLDKNGGACRARNAGIEIARGEYIAFQDSDDEWDVTKLEKQLVFLEKLNADMVYCAYTRIIETTGKKELFPRIMPPTQDKIESTFYRMLLENTCSTQTILCKAACAKEIRFDETLPRLQDWDWALRVAQKYSVGFQKDPLVKAYIQNDSITRSHKKYVIAINIMYNKYSQKINARIDTKYSWIGHLADAEFGLGNRATWQCALAFWGTHKPKYLVKTIICLFGMQNKFSH